MSTNSPEPTDSPEPKDSPELKKNSELTKSPELAESESQVVEAFYQAFQQRDHQKMGAQYHPEVQFQDPVFTLEGPAVTAMWHMLCERGKDLELSFEVTTHNGKVQAHWEPVYTFSQTGKKVHNIIDAQFEFRDGKIYRHRDHFSFWRWSRQALGLPGVLMGWSSVLQNAAGKKANASLMQFIQQHPEYQR